MSQKSYIKILLIFTCSLFIACNKPFNDKFSGKWVCISNAPNYDNYIGQTYTFYKSKLRDNSDVYFFNGEGFAMQCTKKDDSTITVRNKVNGDDITLKYIEANNHLIMEVNNKKIGLEWEKTSE